MLRHPNRCTETGTTIAMSRIAEYFAKSFPGTLSLRKMMTVKAPNSPELTAVGRIHVDFDANVRFLSVLITEREKTESALST
jgi:hypothetical protein